jgi:outer membrane protein
MRRILSLCAGLALVFALRAQTVLDRGVRVEPPAAGWLMRPYSPKTVSGTDLTNSSRLLSLMRAGVIYLTLQDALALALENNMDIELQRFGPAIAAADRQRAEAGGLLRGIPLTLRELPAGVGGPGGPLLTTVGTFSPSGSVSPNLGELAGIAAQETNLSVLGATPLSSGPAVPLLDPLAFAGISYLHPNIPQNSLSSNGVNPLVANNLAGTAGVQKSFASGASVNVSYSTIRQDANWLKTDYNPFTTAVIGLTVTQPLLKGFGPSLNRRYVRIANNNAQISDFAFKQQVINTVSSVIRLYWDLVSLSEDLRVKREAVHLAETLLENNRVQVEVGTLAPIEVKRAQAEVARSRQDLTNADSLLLQQELVIKKVLTRNGLNNPTLRVARITPLDRIEIPAKDDLPPVTDLLSEAASRRPDVAGARLQIQNSEISLRGSKNGLLPSLDIYGSVAGNGLAGTANPLAPAPLVDPAMIGGLGTLLSQVFSGAYPNYVIGGQLSIPIRNRVAQADVVRDQLDLRQSQVRLQNVEEQVRLELESAVLALSRSREAYDAAVQTRQLQQEALEAEQERYTVGASTSFFVIQIQRDLTQAQTTELIARGNYAKARAALDRALGVTLDKYHLSIAEAKSGIVH